MNRSTNDEEKKKGASVFDMLEAAERFQMDDLKDEVARVVKKSICVDNVLELGQLAETFKNKLLLQACAEFITNDGTIEIEDTQVEKMPKLVARILGMMNEQRKKQKEQEERKKQYWQYWDSCH